MKRVFSALAVILIIGCAVLGCMLFSAGSSDRAAENSFSDNFIRIADGFTESATAFIDTVSEKSSQVIDAISFASGQTDISFDETYYPYFAMLSDPLKMLYKQIYCAASEYKKSVTPAAQISAEDAGVAVIAVMNDHPELFWIGSEYKVSYLANGNAVEITLDFTMPTEEIAEAKAKFDTAAEAVIGQAGQLTTFYDREKYIHDYILSFAVYDSENIEAAQSAYSTLVTGKTVCAGYSKAFQYLMTRLNVPTYYCTGYSSGEHAWNIIRLDDGYYNVDLTWDAQDPISYAYFNRTDAEFAESHTRTELSVYLPPCNAFGYSGPDYQNYRLPDFAEAEIPQGMENNNIFLPEAAAIRPESESNDTTGIILF